ncbi:TonB-linked SusC/RagA family outer membrane protein [Pedobacter sp. AK017]|uniref:SusC/RagA family TonB-linked outer membrane protein n=1 Tax=Pedobacter sp. AK017 TaxID=2723073 RepID=UPI0016084BBF|nr:TonB-dependent receptor [Pedobacter sp. AK017]MBB5439959.1 TonB-linked SusC/RagA family outer membrane protein [Pedobacter sp. AK017]
MKPNLLFTMLLVLGIPLAGLAQAVKTITGTVIDEKGGPLPGVKVVLQGKATSGVTDGQGHFSLSNTKEGDLLLVSMIGYTSKTVIVSSQNQYKIQLETSSTSLNDVVIIGYGEVKRKDLTGAVGSVNIKDMEKAPVVSFEDALAGRVAGVQVGSGDGQPGSISNITIRGGNSITQSNSPLYVIDGFPLESPDNNTINPDDIESIDILKDASSTAIYGARGANGVIMIKTKEGKVGAPVVTYNNWLGYQYPGKQIEVMSPYEFVKYQLDLNKTSATALYLKDGKTLDAYRDEQGINWQDHVMQNAFMQNHSFSMRGGTAATKYSVSSSYLNQNGIVINGGYKRYQGRFQIDQRVGQNIRIGLNTNYTYGIKKGQIANLTSDNLNSSSAGNASSYLMYSTWGYRPVTGSGDDGNFLDQPFDDDVASNTDLRINPVVNSNNMYQYAFNKSLSANAFVEYSFLKYFKFKVSGGMTDTRLAFERFNNSNTAAGNPRTVYGQNYGINGSLENQNIRSLLNENLLTFNKTFNKKHRLDAVGGFTMQRNSMEGDGFVSILLPNEVLGVRGLGQGTILSKTTTGTYSTLVSFLSRVNYTFNSRYIFTASLRADGSSKFAPESRWAYFPSGAFAWNIGEEKFLKDIKAISAAKLRLSYGITGNNRVSDFAYLPVLGMEVGANTGNTKSGYYFNGQYIKGTVPIGVGNEDLKWEPTGSFDAGLDLSFFNQRLSITADFYHKRTSDLLLNASLPTSTGYLTAFKNIGVVVNKGFEFTLNTVNLSSKRFNWTSSFNIAFNKNKIDELNGNQPSLITRVTSWNANFNNSLPYIALPGRQVALFYGYVFDGLYQLNDFNVLSNGSYELKGEVPNNGSARSLIKPGFIKYKDINGDGIVDANDQTIIGNPNPLHIGGLTNNFRYGQFDLNVFLQWSYGNDILNANRIVFEGAEARPSLNMFKTYENRWSVENQNSVLPVAGGYGPNVFSDRNIEDGSFLRLKTVSLGYNLSPELMKRLKIQSVRIHVSAQNLVTWTNYSGLDPEVSVRHSALTPGFDWSAYPRARTITFGMNLTF